MNNKHLASVLLFAIIIAFSQGVLMLNKKRQAAQEAAEIALKERDASALQTIRANCADVNTVQYIDRALAAMR